MITLAIRLESGGALLMLQDSEWGIAEACTFEDPFLKGMILEAEYRLEHGTRQPTRDTEEHP